MPKWFIRTESLVVREYVIESPTRAQAENLVNVGINRLHPRKVEYSPRTIAFIKEIPTHERTDQPSEAV